MTERLYYTDPYARSFDARVAAVEPRERGAAVVLDRTAFYPTSGGQPYDTGTLNGLRVVDVIDEDDGRIAHIVEALEGAGGLVEGASVHGEIDWPRRFEHMQQHTGQHVLSASFMRGCGVPTVSFHLGAEAATIDVAREMSAAEIARGELDANRVVWEDRPIAVRFASREEAAALPLRKEPARGGILRLIDIHDWDLSACGGTHVERTGGIGVIAVSGWERFKGGQRIEFLCGVRALRRFGAMRDTLAAATRQLSVTPAELPATVERLQAESKEMRRSAAALQTELARFRASELAAATQSIGGVRAVLRAVDADANGLKALATSIVGAPGMVAVLLSTSRPALVVVARSSDVAVSAQQLLAGLVARFGGRGGGRPELAQGGGLDAEGDAILAHATSLLSV
jgi:alanyl-tRNA synthetase